MKCVGSHIVIFSCFRPANDFGKEKRSNEDTMEGIHQQSNVASQDFSSVDVQWDTADMFEENQTEEDFDTEGSCDEDMDDMDEAVNEIEESIYIDVDQGKGKEEVQQDGRSDGDVVHVHILTIPLEEQRSSLKYSCEGEENINFTADDGESINITGEDGQSINITEDGKSINFVTEDGENINITAEDGESINITGEDGQSINITEDGKSINFVTEDGENINITAEDGENIINIEDIAQIYPMKSSQFDGINVVEQRETGKEASLIIMKEENILWEPFESEEGTGEFISIQDNAKDGDKIVGIYPAQAFTSSELNAEWM